MNWRLLVAATVVWMIAVLAFYGAVGYVLLHFIQKLW